MLIRPAQPADIPQLSCLRATLWPESSADDHASELAQIIAGKIASILPLVVFVAASPDGTLLAFLEAGLRSHADGCDWSHPVG